MHSRWVRWIAYLVLASLVVVTSCRAWAGDASGAAPTLAAGQTGGHGGSQDSGTQD